MAPRRSPGSQGVTHLRLERARHCGATKHLLQHLLGGVSRWSLVLECLRTARGDVGRLFAPLAASMARWSGRARRTPWPGRQAAAAAALASPFAPTILRAFGAQAALDLAVALRQEVGAAILRGASIPGHSALLLGALDAGGGGGACPRAAAQTTTCAVQDGQAGEQLAEDDPRVQTSQAGP